MPCPALLPTFEACHDAALVIGPRGEVLHLNEPARRLFEWGGGSGSVSGGEGSEGGGRGGGGGGQASGAGGGAEGEDPTAGGALRRRTVSSFFTFQAADANRNGGTGQAAKEGRSWSSVARSLGWARHESRSATGYRADGSSFPASVNLLKLDERRCVAAASVAAGAASLSSAERGAVVGAAGDPEAAPTKGGDEDSEKDVGSGGGGSGPPSLSDASSYVCAFIRDLASERRAVELERRVRELERENLRLSRMRDALLEASGESTVIVDEDGIVQSVDDATVRLFGYREGELVGRNISVLMGEDHAPKHDSYMKRYINTGVKRVIGQRRELEARKKDGTMFPMELGVSEIKTDPGEKRMFVGTISDVSPKMRAYSMLERSERIRRNIMDASFDAMFSISEEGVVLTANRAASDMFGWTADELKGRNVDSFIKEEKKRNSDYGISFRRYRQREPDGFFLKFVAASEMDDSDVSTRCELIGRRADGSEFPVEIGLARIKSVTDDDGERLYCGFVHDLTKRKAAESELRRKNAATAGIIEAAFDAVFYIDDVGTIEMVNDAAVLQFGWTREEFIGRNISMICGGGHGRNHDRYIRRYLMTGEKRVMGKKRELPARRKDGKEFYIELGLSEVKTEGDNRRGRRHFCGFVRDLTGEKNSKIELRRKQNMTSSIIEAAFDAMFFINEQGTILLVNSAAVKQFGWSREEFVGRNISMICGGGRAPHHDSYIKRYLKTGEKRVMGKKRELLARRKDETEFPIELGLTEVRTEDGEERQFCGFIRDLTRQKADEAELKRKQNRTMGILEASFDAMFLIDEYGTIRMVNSAAVTQFGWSREEFLGQNIKMICGGGRSPHHDGYIQRYLRTGEKRVMGKKRELEARRKDGTEFPIELGLWEVNTDDGECRQFCGFIKDLTDQKAYEMELKRKQRATLGIIEASFDAMFYINENGIIQMVNEMAIALFGWSREEFLGLNISMIVGGPHTEKHDQYIQRYLKTGEKRVMGKKRELPARKKDGSQFPIELGLTEVKTEEGELRQFCGFIKDLTDQKAFETELKRKQRVTMGIIEASFDAMFFIDERGTIDMVNGAAVKQFGWSREEFMGRNISMIAGGAQEGNHDDYIQRYLRTGERQKRELLARRKDGSEFPIELGLTEVKRDPGEGRRFCGFIKDLTELKEGHVKLQQKQTMTMGIVEASFDAMLYISENGVIQMVNGATIRQFGWTRDELIGSNISMICGGDHGSKHDGYLRRYLETGETRIMGTKREVPARRKDGSEFPIELGLVEVKGMGGARCFCGFVRDISRRKAYEAEIARKQSLASGIVEASLDAMLAIDDKGIIKIANEAAVSLFGRGREELIGRNIVPVIIPPDEAEMHREFMRQFLEPRDENVPQKRIEGEFWRRDGTRFPCKLSVNEVEHTGDSRLFALFFHDLSDHKRMVQMEVDKAKAETLLLNMLPEDIALRLKHDQEQIADHYPNVAILFADIVGFTTMASSMSPQDVVAILNQLFSKFDDLVDKYDLNKVKTIGDCYMVTSHPDIDTHVDEIKHICNMGFDMIDAVKRYNIDSPGTDLNLRVGINTGPVVAGVVGTKRFLYDIWGDAVNLASRMESTGIPGKIHVTQNVINHVGDDFRYESRGTMHVKGKGEMETFILEKRQDKMPPRLPGKKRLMRRRSQLIESLKTLESSKKLLDTKIHDLEAELSDEA